MDLGFPADITLYKLRSDWGSFIGGILALVAGVIAFLAGRMQAVATRQQNEALLRENKRKRAAESLVASRLLLAVVSRIKVDVGTLSTAIDQPAYSSLQQWFPLAGSTIFGSLP